MEKTKREEFRQNILVNIARENELYWFQEEPI